MKEQRYGIEIELTGITRLRAVKTIAEVLGMNPESDRVADGHGRYWKIKNDASISIQGGQAVEIISPICKYEDIETVQKIVRAIRNAGGKVNNTCGIHVHVDASPHNAASLKNIVNIVAAKEDIIFKALRVGEERERYCKKIERRFFEELNKKKNKTMDDIRKIWYDDSTTSTMHSHYDFTRYHALNLHAVFEKGTIEFRMFNGTLHAGEIKAYIQFCLAISHQALTQTRASGRTTRSSNERYTFRTWLLRLGLIGDEFKTARMHLLKNLGGNIAWRYRETTNERAA